LANYARLNSIVLGLKSNAGTSFEKNVIPVLIDLWLDDYDPAGTANQIVETNQANSSFLFDIAQGRLIAAWAISEGKHTGERDRSRMAGHPLGGGPHLHRGHAIPHTLGGPLDINLVPQLGSINIGPFRVLEIEAVNTPGALYFTHWIYSAATHQKPASVEQGLLIPGAVPRIITHIN
jgi:hypothetical protein